MGQKLDSTGRRVCLYGGRSSAPGYLCAWNESCKICMREGVRASGLQHLREQ